MERDKKRRRSSRTARSAPPQSQITTYTCSLWRSLGVGLSDRMVEVERIEQVVERRAVGRHIRIVLRDFRVGKIVTAAGRQRLELPVALDELQDRNVVAITVMDLSAGRIRRENQQRNTRPIAEEVERLDEARV